MEWQCDFCGKEFKTKKEAEKHEKNCKKKDNTNKNDFNSKNQVKEYKRKCKECGKVWHVLASREEKLQKDLKSNQCDQMTSACGMCGGNWMALQSSTQAKRNEHALTDEVTRLKHCPNCGSGNYEEKEIVYKKK